MIARVEVDDNLNTVLAEQVDKAKTEGTERQPFNIEISKLGLLSNKFSKAK